MSRRPTLNPDYIQALRELVNASPFPSHVPFEVSKIEHDETVVTLVVDENHMQPLRTVHGGIIATLIDTATYWAGFVNIAEEDGMVSVDLKLNYLKPTTSGILTAKGRCIRAGRSLSYAEAYVTNDEEKVVAHGTSTLMTIPGQGLGIDFPKFLNGN